MDGLSRLVSITPVVTSANAALANVKVLGVIDVLVRTRLNTVYDAGFQVYEDRSGYISCIVTLVVEDILAITAFGRKVFQVAILVDSVFLA